MLNGLLQQIHIKGNNEKNPVLLFLHGGPGVTNRHSAILGNDDLLDDFTIVAWDQRGTAGSYKGARKEDLTLEQLTKDAKELVSYLCNKFYFLISFILKIEPINTCTSSLKGLYFNYLYDVLNNILNNVLNYQKHSQKEIWCKVLVEESYNTLHIKVVNNVLEKDIPEIKENIERAVQNCEKDVASGKVSGENGTGIAKIYNVVKNILNHAENKYTTTVDENDYTVTSDVSINLDNIKL